MCAQQDEHSLPYRRYKAYCAINRTACLLWALASMSLCYYYYAKLRYSPSQTQHASNLPCRALAIHQDELFLAVEAWRSTMKTLRRSWKLALLGCALVVPLSVALLQIDSIIGNVYTRTLAIAGFIMAGGGFVLAMMLLIIVPQLRGRNGRKLWIDASAGSRLRTSRSVEFWTLVALPIATLAYSIIFCAAVLLVMTWNEWQMPSETGGPAMEKPGNMSSAAFLLALMVIVIFYIYKMVRLGRFLL